MHRILRALNGRAPFGGTGALGLCLFLSVTAAGAGQRLAGVSKAPVQTPASPVLRRSGGVSSLGLRGEPAFHTTEREVVNFRMIDVPGEKIRLALWDELGENGSLDSFYAISLDGSLFSRVRRTSYVLKLRGAELDPVRGVPRIPQTLRADGDCNLYIVQFVTQPLEAFRRRLRASGATVHKFVANHAHIVEMDASVKAGVESLPYVRSVQPFHPAYRLEGFLRERISQRAAPLPLMRYNIQVAERGRRQKAVVADRIKALGGVVEAVTPDGFLLEATLTHEQLIEVVRRDEVLFVDRWLPPESDTDIARRISGANFIETVAGYTGQGVRAEVMDTNVVETHQDLKSAALIFHGPRDDDAEHGTSAVGIHFGDGSGDPDARGIVPGARGIFADFEHLKNRHAHTAELTQGPYFAVYQSNSWGNGGTTDYNSQSADFDDLLFLNDILVCQSQSNNGDRRSRVQAWAKNVVSVGGVNHLDTLDRSDDRWDGGASVGPASDGRIKPDLAHFYDAVYTLAADGGYRDFCCTSAATAITAGYFGLFFQMWHEGVFGMPTAGTVFHSRPHMTTAKAMMINTANQYTFTGADHDLTRTHQGWGMVDVERLFELRDRFFIIDETDTLGNLESNFYALDVPPGEPAFRATLVYADPAGAPFSSQHRINDLTLRVTSPDQTVYYGNNGLLEGNWSQPGGEPNTIDTVENVFVEAPASGQWTVEVLADEINEDGHLETPAIDADYALVVSGVTAPRAAFSYFDDDDDGDVDLRDYDRFRECFTGPYEAAGFDELLAGCQPADCDGDGDVDLIDYACFAQSFTDDCGVHILTDLSDQEACDGDTIVFDPEASGADVRVQWLRDGVPIPGADRSVLTIEAATNGDEGAYNVIAWTECGLKQSRVANLTVPLPAFGFIWPLSRSVCMGASVEIDAYVRGEPPLALQWQIDGVDIPGATSVPYVIDHVDVDDLGSYRVIVTDNCGLCDASNLTELLLKNVAFIEQPTGGDICVGDSIELSAVVRGSATFQWYKDDVPMVGERQPVLVIEDASLDDAGAYRLRATNECNVIISRVAFVTVTDCGDSP